MLLLDDTVERMKELYHMVTVDCPWCDGAMAFEAEADDVACEGCNVRVELAPDPHPVLIVRAA